MSPNVQISLFASPPATTSLNGLVPVHSELPLMVSHIARNSIQLSDLHGGDTVQGYRT